MPYEKVGDNEPVCIADEAPFEIPDGWEWVRLKNISQLIGGYAFKSNSYKNEGIRVIRISDFDNNGLLYDEYKYYIESQSLSNYEIYNNDILMCMTGGTVGKCCFLNTIKEKLYLNQRVADIRCSKLISQYYVYNVLISYYIKELINASKTSTNDNISMETIGDFFIPLPPLQEQQRIVSEIERYLPLIDEYDKLQTELDTLDKEFPEKLKKSILQQAIKGKLVEQDPSDEPASVLLDKIRKEKEKLIKEGKIKKDKNESVIYKRDNSYYEKLNGVEKCIDDEIPFEIPESWEWCRLKSVINLISGQDLDTNKCNNISEGIPYITGASNFINETLIINRWTNYGSIFAFKNDLLLTCKGTIGMMAFLTINKAHIARQIMSIRPISNAYISINFIKWFFNFYVNQLKNVAKSIIPGINRDNVLNSLFPIPPLKEQEKIVEKIVRALNILKLD